MPKSLTLDIKNSIPYLNYNELEYLQPLVKKVDEMLRKKNGFGNQFLGWLDLPVNYDREEFKRVKKAAERIKNNSDVLIVIGIGGSYLGAKAAIEMLTHTFYNNLNKNKRKTPSVIFVGNNISSTYMADLLEMIEGMDLSVNVISKSGTTTEPAIAFRIFRHLLEKKYGKIGARERIFVTTDKEKGLLRVLANKEGYETFVIPDDIGGRYSVLTSVGLLPIASSGIDIEEIMKGAQRAREEYNCFELDKNDAYKYAAVRNILYRKGKTIEMIVNFEPCLHYFGEWWKQLYGESEGKDNKGIFPASADFSTDLHSIGQYIQQGRKDIFETFINVEKPRKEFIIDFDEEDIDKLNFIAGKSMDFVNKQAFMGSVLAHSNDNVPVMILNLPQLTPYYFGYMVYFFEKACAMSGYLLGVNPFDQPGVEIYKKNMFALLGKPGYEDKRDEINKKFLKKF